MDVNFGQCYEYVTLLNLRNWGKVGAAYVTEQIYVHSKMMIVDDRFAILGSANINDRSLLGERDFELAVLVADLDGAGRPQPVQRFAHDLRKAAWRKLFGFTPDELRETHTGVGHTTPGNRAARALEFAIEHPANPESWRAIQKQATLNKELYEGAFPFIPRDYLYGDTTGAYASVLPTCSSKLKNERDDILGGLTRPLPFQDAFRSLQQYMADAGKPASVKGFFTAPPLYWTKNENIGITYTTAIIVKNDPYETSTSEPDPRFASTDVDRNSREPT